MTTTPLQIIILPVERWPEYKQLRLEALSSEPQSFSTTYQDAAAQPDTFWQGRLAQAGQANGSWLLFAESQGKLVGMIGAFVDASEPQAAWVISVYVTQSARGRGISKQLMQAILDELKGKGFQTARLSVNASKPVAVNLYTGFGFTRYSSEISRMADGKDYEEVFMEKGL